MGEHSITALMLLVGGIHLLPLVGFVGPRQLSRLYGIEAETPELEILMRHRAVLFGILGAFFTYAAFVPALQPLAFAAAGVSVGSFLYLAATVDGYGQGVRKIVFADLIATLCLFAAITIYALRAHPA